MTENNRILIADDNPANCELLQAYLEEVDCQIELAIDTTKLTLFDADSGANLSIPPAE